MTFDFLSPEAKRAVIAAQRLARTRDQEVVELEHLLRALLDSPDTEAALLDAGADREALVRKLEQAMAGFAKVPGAKVYLGERVLRLLDIAQVEARERGQERVEPEHLLVGIPLETRSGAAEVLRKNGVTLPKLEAALARRSLRPRGPPTDPQAQGPAGGVHAAGGDSGEEEGLEPPTPLLAKYARDLTALGAAGKLDPVVARDAEIRRVMQILGRRSKNNPLLVGDPGVGKTAIVEGLATRIATGDVPAGLRGKRIYSLDIGALLAGAKFRGEFEDRIRGVLAEVKEAAGAALLFFDEIHTLLGAGQGGEGSLDAADLLKPALARGEITCIGATTVEEYRLHVERDPAFERRFLPVVVEEPGEEACLAMLRGLRPRYEAKHQVRIEDEALAAAVKMSHRYVAGRSLPDKALDLLDEAGSRLRLELDSHPDEIDALARRERAIGIELSALAADQRPEARARRERLDKTRAELLATLSPLREKWQAELAAIGRLKDASAAENQSYEEATAAERQGDLARASQIRFGRLPELAKTREKAREELRRVQGKERLLEDAVEPLHVARVVADWTGIPVARMLETERQKILHIEDSLRRRVIGQDEAVRVVGHAVKRARAGMADAGRPIGSFLFLGPTGVGKTELSKALAEFLFDDEHALVRLDMSEYMEKHAVARLTGAPPGYVGYEEGGQLTEAVRRRPYSVVLFDEVEKAHPDVFNVLLALLDDGRLTDSRGRTVGFTNTVLILTSNLGASAILTALERGDRAGMEAEVKAALRAHFRPEFLNRIDETVIFNPLGPKEIEAIVDLQLARLARLMQGEGLGLEVTPAARALLARESYDPAFGARPVKRCLQRRLRDPLSEQILEGRFVPGDRILVDSENETLAFSKHPPT